MGYAHYINNDYKKANKYYNIAIKLNPSNPSGYYFLSLAYKEGKNYKSSINVLNKAIELNYDFVLAYYERGNIYSYQGKNMLMLVNDFET